MKDHLNAIRDDIDSALAAVAAKHNLSSLKCGSASYTVSSFTFKLEGLAQGGKSLEAGRYEMNAKLMNLPPLGTVFQSGPKMYRAVGMNATGTKIYVARLPDNKEFLMDTQMVCLAAGVVVTNVG